MMKHLGAGVLMAFLSVGMSTDAIAYIVCSENGDCWRSNKRIKVPGVSLVFHSENWWKKNSHNRRYTWHEAETGRDTRHGYWNRGAWHKL